MKCLLATLLFSFIANISTTICVLHPMSRLPCHTSHKNHVISSARLFDISSVWMMRVTLINFNGVFMRHVSNLRVLALSLLFTSALNAQPAEAPPIDRLRQSMLLTAGSINARWGIYVKSFATGEEVAINADVEMETMSTIKIPLMIEVFQQIHDNKFKLTDKYTLLKTDVNSGTGTLQFMDPGAVITVKDLLTYMIVVSDNTATEVLYRMVGGIAPVNARMKALGLSHTRAATIPSKWFAEVATLRGGNLEQALHDGKIPFGITTPREMGQLLEMMERKTLVDEASSELMLTIMRRQVYRTRLPRYLGYTYAIPHKTGDFPPYIANDVGIIELPDVPVVMCVFNGDYNGRYDVLENAIGLMALDVRNYFVYRAK
jgi:beta-lactamase class A